MRQFLLILIVLSLYFAPTLVAMWRRHYQTLAIAVLNLVLGFTGLGWIAALVWALRGAGRATTTYAISDSAYGGMAVSSSEKLNIPLLAGCGGLIVSAAALLMLNSQLRPNTNSHSSMPQGAQAASIVAVSSTSLVAEANARPSSKHLKKTPDTTTATSKNGTVAKVIKVKNPINRALSIRRAVVGQRSKAAVGHHGPVPGKLYTDGVPQSERTRSFQYPSTADE